MKFTTTIFVALLFLCSTISSLNLRHATVFNRNELDGQTIHVQKGEHFKIKLEGDILTGLGWKLSDHQHNHNHNILRTVGLSRNQFGDHKNGVFTFEFEADKVGSDELLFQYKRFRGDNIEDQVRTNIVVSE